MNVLSVICLVYCVFVWAIFILGTIAFITQNGLHSLREEFEKEFRDGEHVDICVVVPVFFVCFLVSPVICLFLLIEILKKHFTSRSNEV